MLLQEIARTSAEVAATPPRLGKIERLASVLRRASMLAGDLGTVAAAAIGGGRDAVARFRLTVLRPVQPMLAQTVADVEQALGRIRPAAIEWKLDGARLQVHRLGREVRAFT